MSAPLRRFGEGWLVVGKWKSRANKPPAANPTPSATSHSPPERALHYPLVPVLATYPEYGVSVLRRAKRVAEAVTSLGLVCSVVDLGETLRDASFQ